MIHIELRAVAVCKADQFEPEVGDCVVLQAFDRRIIQARGMLVYVLVCLYM
jgi:hypothetical protein